ncbi:MAG: shikimate dehydrogenase [Flavobacteriales bacterium]|nr:shikimate dehydrogenase [Flavobacteriales bacterium]
MKVYGLLGKTLYYSFSEQYFSEKFLREKIVDTSYQNFELVDIDNFPLLIKEINTLRGLNVTIPYKEKIISFLDELDPIAQHVSAVNTIKIEANGQLKGYNTDVIGFRDSIKPFLDPNHSRALIFGTGGASKAIAFVLEELLIPYYFVSRNGAGEKIITYSDLDKSSIASFRFLINSTPVGTFPDVNTILPIDLDGIGDKHLVYDLVYNPEQSLLLKEAKKRGAITVNGLSMLKIQAEASWKIWND